MKPIFAIPSAAAHPSTTVAGTNHVSKTKAEKVHQPEQNPSHQTPKPDVDEYLPEEKKEPSGHYWLEQDKEEHKNHEPQKTPKNNKPEKNADGNEPEICRGNSDKVEREIRQLKEKKKELEQQCKLEKDEAKAEKLKQELSQVESELRQKDNDNYRRQHTIFS